MSSSKIDLFNGWHQVRITDEQPIKEGDLVEYNAPHEFFSKGDLHPVYKHEDSDGLFIRNVLLPNGKLKPITSGMFFDIVPEYLHNFTVWRHIDNIKPNMLEREVIQRYMARGQTVIPEHTVYLPQEEFMTKDAEGIIEALYEKYPLFERFTISLNTSRPLSSMQYRDVNNNNEIKHNTQFYVDLEGSEVIKTFRVEHLR